MIEDSIKIYKKMAIARTKDCINYQKEIERLNNIINELVKELEEVFNKMEEKQIEIGGRGYYYTDLLPIENILDKLKKLKGDK